MSFRSSLYRSLDNKTLSCLHNYFLQNNTQAMIFDYNTGMYYARTQPQDINIYNKVYQEYFTSEYKPDNLAFATDSFTGPVVTGLPGSSYYFFAVIKPWEIYRYYSGFNPPRDKYNVRRSYWTGKPRKRLNL